LKIIISHCRALRTISHAGVDGFHWRVRMDDKAANSREPSYSWWDIQDENARLPTKDNITLSQLQQMMMSASKSSSSLTSNASVNAAANKASGAIRSLGKVMNAAVSGDMHPRRDDRDDPNAPRVSVIAFKLLDLMKVQEKASQTVGYSASPQQHRYPSRSNTASIPPADPQSAPHVPTRATPPQQPVRQPSAAPANQRPPQPRQRQVQPLRRAPSAAKEPSLMDFVSSSTPVPTTRPQAPSASQPAKTRAEKLKQEYEQKKRTQNKVWDDVDQRWVEVDPNSRSKSSSEPPAPPSTKKNIKGIAIDASNAIGKSANVQAAVQSRVKEMEDAQQNAINDLKQREAKVQQDADEEDLVRKRLEPKLRAWSEEHGKKKQLRALLSSLHMILWEGSGWKQVSLGDILEEKKARRCYLKATLKVHPDKTRDLDAEKRFIAKRVFDALSQAMTDFENKK